MTKISLALAIVGWLCSAQSIAQGVDPGAAAAAPFIAEARSAIMTGNAPGAAAASTAAVRAATVAQVLLPTLEGGGAALLRAYPYIEATKASVATGNEPAGIAAATAAALAGSGLLP